jgi:hypothetical protein
MSDTSMDFNSRYYLIESVQQIVETIGVDCVLTGLDILNVSIDNDSHFLTANLSKGKVICNSTLIEFPDDMNLPLDLSNLDIEGKIILSVSFKYLRTSRPNLATISLKFLNYSYICSEWFEERDKIVLAIFSYNKALKTVTTTQSTYLDKQTVYINNKEYEIRPFNYTIQQLRPLLKSFADTIF